MDKRLLCPFADVGDVDKHVLAAIVFGQSDQGTIGARRLDKLDHVDLRTAGVEMTNAIQLGRGQIIFFLAIGEQKNYVRLEL